MKTPLVSVVMATYNDGAEYIKCAIESILKQTYENVELLVVDDSTDEATIKAIDAFSSDGRVHIIRSDKKNGFVPSLNIGLRAAKGEFVARMDGDDIAKTDRFEKQVKFLQAHENVDVIGGNINIINESNEVISYRNYPERGIKFFIYSVLRSPLAHPTVMFRRRVVDEGFFYDENLKKSEDLDLWLRLLNASYVIQNIPETLLDYRVASDFGDKRTDRSQIDAVGAVRRKNFSAKRFFFSVLSVLATTVFSIVPESMIKGIYKKENSKNK